MPAQLKLELTQAQRRELEVTRDRHRLPYVRERAAGLLKIADGEPAYAVADRGLLKPRSRKAVRGWYQRYVSEGISGLVMRTGRGRKPAFSPSADVV